MSVSVHDRYILYIGNFLNSKAVEERGLPSFNVAGSNRMSRISNALRVSGQKVLLLSPGASLRMGWQGKLLHPAYLCRSGQTLAYFCPAVGLTFVNAVLEPIFLLFSIYSLRKRVRFEKAIIYNFSPSFLIISLVLRYVWKIHLINNIEDISRPKLSDWLPKSDARPIQQITFSVCMDAISRLSDGLIIPTQRFLSDLPTRKPVLIISGCMPVYEKSVRDIENEKPLNILFSGKIEFEHGIHFLINALKQLDREREKLPSAPIFIHICGHGSKVKWLTKQLSKITHLSVNYHGFVDKCTYQSLLDVADICIALQDPAGRHSTYKTPSKVYEYLGSGKLVVSTNVGDLASLPSDMIEICEPNVSTSLASVLENLIRDRQSIAMRKYFAAQYSKNNFSYPVVGQRLKSFVFSKSG